MAELPDDIREVVLSSKLGEGLRAIGQKHNLHIDQVGALEDEAMLVMLGFFAPESFSEQIARELNLPLADATAIAAEVNEQVFLPIRESMQAFAEAKRAEVKPAPVTPPPIAAAATGFAQAPVAPAPAIPQQNPITPPAAPASTGFGQVATVPKPPAAPQAQPAPTPTPSAAPAPTSPAEQMLTQPTVAKPIYKADPYREPIE